MRTSASGFARQLLTDSTSKSLHQKMRSSGLQTAVAMSRCGDGNEFSLNACSSRPVRKDACRQAFHTSKHSRLSRSSQRGLLAKTAYAVVAGVSTGADCKISEGLPALGEWFTACRQWRDRDENAPHGLSTRHSSHFMVTMMRYAGSPKKPDTSPDARYITWRKREWLIERSGGEGADPPPPRGPDVIGLVPAQSECSGNTLMQDREASNTGQGDFTRSMAA